MNLNDLRKEYNLQEIKNAYSEKTGKKINENSIPDIEFTIDFLVNKFFHYCEKSEAHIKELEKKTRNS